MALVLFKQIPTDLTNLEFLLNLFHVSAHISVSPALVLRCVNERIIAIRTEAPRGQCLLMTPSLHLPCMPFVTDSLSFCMKRRHLQGAGEMAQMLKALTDLVDDQDLILASMWYFMTVFNYSSMKFHSSIYGLWVLYTRYTYIQVSKMLI